MGVSNQTFAAGAIPLINGFYNGLSGVSSTTVSGTLTSANLAGLDLLHLPFLSSSLTSAERSTVLSFLNNGGSLFVTGEALFSPSNVNVNGLLSFLGSSISIATATNLDPGSQTATGTRIATDPLTTGVTSYAYGATSVVNGGTSLFFTTNATQNRPFVAYEQFSTEVIPEPATFAVWSILGLCGIGYHWRRKRKAA